MGTQVTNEFLKLFGLEPVSKAGNNSAPIRQTETVKSSPAPSAQIITKPGEWQWGKPSGLTGTGIKMFPYMTLDMATRILPVIPGPELKQARKGSNWRLFFAVLWQTGMRIGEALALVREDIDSDSVLVRTEKRPDNFVRRLPLQSMLAGELQAHIRALPVRQRRLFAYGARRASQVLKQAAAKAGYDARVVHPHMIRHGFAMNYLRQNGKTMEALSNLQRWLGHRSIKTTMVYLEPMFEDMQADVERMNF